MAVIALGHVALIALALLGRGPERDVEQAAPIVVSLMSEHESEPPPSPLPRPVPVELMPVAVVPTLINIEVPPEVAPPPITVAAVAPPSAPVAPPVSRGDSSEPILVTSVEYLRPPVVSYPAAAKQARATGTVHIRAFVDTDGRVREVRVDRSSGFSSLDKAASESVLGALFKPYMRDGVARAAVVIVPVDFALKVRDARHGNSPSPQELNQLVAE